MKLKALESIERLFVTCSMTSPSADIGVEELARAHRRQGYSTVAVHHVIRRDGTVEAGRDESVRGAASPTFSDCALQVCLIGGLNDALEPKGTFTEEQTAALLRLRDAYGVPLFYGLEPPLLALKETLKEP
ncbi:hypothetical protein [Luteibacter sp. ME-Dv--P-043b]|uniref:hypothetical protein n=1 Tax=Luteibacter sp. ME-Dv--P-043b TaxID=3040291 RepID=UPI002553D2B6|nr:hypothetical protein [Luteibacter sp. ME-Dv--P-043b]